MAVSEDTFFLDARFEGTLQSQIQQMVAEGILSGRFRPGEKLPSSRRLAKHLGVSRITVTLAYTELLANDFLRSAGRSGYFVSETAPRPPAFTMKQHASDGVDWNRAIGQRFKDGRALTKPADWRKYRFPFIYGQADPELLDIKSWRLCALQTLGQREFESLTADLGDRDDPKLVEFITRHILPRRGIAAKPSEILITLGAQNGLWLAAQVLLTQRRTAAFETPCYPSLRAILSHSRCIMEPILVDEEGLPPDRISAEADVVFVTPSHQCPTNATMPIDRRRALLQKAQDEDMLIVEDDYEFELSFLKAPHPALKSLDQTGRVIYAGSFSKSLFPGLRLGFLVGAEPFIEEARALRSEVLRHPPGHIQRATAQFLSLGHYDAHIRNMRDVFHDRRKIMAGALKECGLRVVRAADFGGSCFWMQAPDAIDTEYLAQELVSDSVLIEPGGPFFGEDGPANCFRLAYSSIPASRIPEGIRLLANRLNVLEQAVHASHDRGTSVF